MMLRLGTSNEWESRDQLDNPGLFCVFMSVSLYRESGREAVLRRQQTRRWKMVALMWADQWRIVKKLILRKKQVSKLWLTSVRLNLQKSSIQLTLIVHLLQRHQQRLWRKSRPRHQKTDQTENERGERRGRVRMGRLQCLLQSIHHLCVMVQPLMTWMSASEFDSDDFRSLLENTTSVASEPVS